MARRSLDEILAAIEAEIETSEDRYGHRIWGMFLKADRSLRRGRRPEEAAWVVKAGQAFLLRVRRGSKNERYFGPIVSGDGWESPEWSSFDSAVCDFYRRRARATTSIRAQARYADIVWGKEQDHEMARCAIDAYLQLSHRYLEREWWLEYEEAITRSLHLAAAVSDAGRYKEGLDLLVSTQDRLAKANEFESTHGILDALLEFGRGRVDDSLAEWALELALRAASYSQAQGGESLWAQRSFLEKASGLARRLGRDDKPIQLDIARSLEEHGTGHNSPMVGSSFVSEAIQRYQSVGAGEDAARLAKTLEKLSAQAQSEFGVIESEVAIDQRKVDEYVSSFVLSNLEESLRHLSSSFWPNMDELIARVEESKRDHPLLFMIPTKTYVGDGRLVGSSTSEEERYEHQLKFQLRFHTQASATFIKLVFDRLQNDQELSSDALADYLLGSDLIQADREPFIRLALERYYAQDWAGCIHLLVPQFERVMRSVLKRLGKRHTRMDPKQIVRVKTLDTILEDEAIKDALGEGLYRYFHTFLVDQESENVRNQIAHGEIEWEQCNVSTATTLVHMFMIITVFKLEHPRAGGTRA